MGFIGDLRQLLEELGYEALDPLAIDIPLAFASMAAGDVDVYPSGWFPLHNSYLDSTYGDVEVVGYVVEQGALQGYLVDRASAEELNITSLEDFKRDEVKQTFDRNGDGKADLVACPAGWGCELTIAHQMDAFELHDHVNEIKAGYSASMADAIAAYQTGEPIFYYTWTPNWTVNELVPGEDVVWIETPSIALPEEQQDMADTATVSGVVGCVADPCQLGWPVNDISVVASSAFLEENPAVRTLLELASVDIDFIYAQNAAMRDGENSKEDLRRQAAEYIEANREAVDGWIEQAIASAQ
ncbi:glycine betaine/L-proline ABC transporter substrate-binding protein ProX [Devosia sp. 1635]|uniref:glycine betaine/L-proline ABC transporter substrate-binding protein ProX n=1 Tax=Devosia sp. 1635 TaxID=2726066 RepID=UPI0020BEBE77|nr:glycine betaine/L-proline ABC transporter substrate-binding protein ProX [Devosia sp. 1635]